MEKGHIKDKDLSNADKLDEVYRLAHENYKLLHKMQNHNRWATVFRVLQWLFLIIVAVIIFYYIQPYIEALVNAYNQLAEGINKVKEVGDKIPEFPDLSGIFGGEGE